jgi:ankyrin repeat protein
MVAHTQDNSAVVSAFTAPKTFSPSEGIYLQLRRYNISSWKWNIDWSLISQIKPSSHQSTPMDLPLTKILKAMSYTAQTDLMSSQNGYESAVLPIHLTTLLLNNITHSEGYTLSDAYQWLIALSPSEASQIMKSLPASIHDAFRERVFIAAIEAGDANVVQNMLSLGIDPLDIVSGNWDSQSIRVSPLVHAIQKGCFLVIKVLVQHICRGKSVKQVNKLYTELLQRTGTFNKSGTTMVRSHEWRELLQIALSAGASTEDHCLADNKGDLHITKLLVQVGEHNLGIFFQVSLLEECLHGDENSDQDELARNILHHVFSRLNSQPMERLPTRRELLCALHCAAKAQQTWAIKVVLQALVKLGFRVKDGLSINDIISISTNQGFQSLLWCQVVTRRDREVPQSNLQIWRSETSTPAMRRHALTQAIQQDGIEYVCDMLESYEDNLAHWTDAVEGVLELGQSHEVVTIIQRMEARHGYGYYAFIILMRDGNTEIISTLLIKSARWTTALEAAKALGEFGALADLTCGASSRAPYFTSPETPRLNADCLEQIMFRALAYHAMETNDFSLCRWLLKLQMGIDEIIHQETSDKALLSLAKRSNVNGSVGIAQRGFVDDTTHILPSLLALAAQNDRIPWIKFLLDECADGRDSMALLRAVEFGAQFTTIRSLLEVAGRQRRCGRHPYGPRALVSAVDRRDMDIIELLCGSVDIDRAESSTVELMDGSPGYTPLGAAIIEGDVDMVGVLLQKGADPNAYITNDGYCGYEYRAKLSPRTSPILAAIKVGSLVKVAKLVESGAKIGPIREHGPTQTPLQRAVELGEFDIMQYLVEQGAPIDTVPVYAGATALQLAAIEGYIGLATYLLEHGANPNYPPAEGDGRTAFEGAAEWGRIDMMALLMQTGVQLDMKVGTPPESQYERAVRFAQKNGFPASKRYVQSLYKQFSQIAISEETPAPSPSPSDGMSLINFTPFDF